MATTNAHQVPTTALPGNTAVWNGAYVVLTAALVAAGGVVALYALTRSQAGLGPALAVVLVQLAVVAAASTIVGAVLRQVCHRLTDTAR